MLDQKLLRKILRNPSFFAWRVAELARLSAFMQSVPAEVELEWVSR